MNKTQLVKKIEYFNKYSPVKIGLNDRGGSKLFLVVNGTTDKITPQGMTINQLWDHMDTLENFVHNMEEKTK